LPKKTIHYTKWKGLDSCFRRNDRVR